MGLDSFMGNEAHSTQFEKLSREESLLKQLRKKSPLIRVNALEGLSKIHHLKAVQAVVASLSDSRSYVRATAAGCLGTMKNREGIVLLI
jgi:HEAT repeat protein